MPLNYSFTFSTIEMSVRYGGCNTSCQDTISCYVQMGLERAKKMPDIMAAQQAHMRVINTLIDAMCDHCVTKVWRKECYRYITRLAPLLYEMLDHQQYKKKIKEINTLRAYYFEENQIKYQLPTSNIDAYQVQKNNIKRQYLK